MFKRFLVILMSVLLAFQAVPALSDPETVDLAAMSLQELAELQHRVELAMFASKEWQSVEVPEGAYRIGDQIPAGTWTLTPTPGLYSSIKIVDKVNETGTRRADDGKTLLYQVIAHKDSFMAEDYPATSYTLTLTDGLYLIIEDGPVIFTPAGTPSFTFK